MTNPHINPKTMKQQIELINIIIFTFSIVDILMSITKLCLQPDEGRLILIIKVFFLILMNVVNFNFIVPFTLDKKHPKIILSSCLLQAFGLNLHNLMNNQLYLDGMIRSFIILIFLNFIHSKNSKIVFIIIENFQTAGIYIYFMKQQDLIDIIQFFILWTTITLALCAYVNEMSIFKSQDDRTDPKKSITADQIIHINQKDVIFNDRQNQNEDNLMVNGDISIECVESPDQKSLQQIDDQPQKKEINKQFYEQQRSYSQEISDKSYPQSEQEINESQKLHYFHQEISQSPDFAQLNQNQEINFNISIQDVKQSQNSIILQRIPKKKQNFQIGNQLNLPQINIAQVSKQQFKSPETNQIRKLRVQRQNPPSINIIKDETNILPENIHNQNYGFKRAVNVATYLQTKQLTNNFNFNKSEEHDQIPDLLMKNSPQGICCINHNFEIIYENQQLYKIMSVNGKNNNIIIIEQQHQILQKKIFNLKTIQIFQNPDEQEANIQMEVPKNPEQDYSIGESNDFLDFANILKLGQKFHQSKQFIDYSSFLQSHQCSQQFQKELQEDQQKIRRSQKFSARLLLSSSFDMDDKKSGLFRQNSNGLSLFKRSYFQSKSLIQDNSLEHRQVYLFRNNINLFQIIDGLFSYIMLKKTSQNQEEQVKKTIDFQLVSTFKKDQQTLEISFFFAYNSKDPIIFLTIIDISENYLYRQVLQEQDECKWQNQHNNDMIQMLLNGIMPLIELSQKQNSFNECNSYLQKAQQFYKIFQLTLMEQNILQQQKAQKQIIKIQLDPLQICIDLIDEISNFWNQELSTFQINNSNITSIYSDPKKLKLIIWNIIQIFVRLFILVNIQIMITQEDNFTIFKIKGKGQIQNTTIIDYIYALAQQTVQKISEDIYKDSRIEFMINLCQLLSIDLSQNKDDFKLKIKVINEQSSEIELQFSVLCLRNEQNSEQPQDLIESSTYITQHNIQNKFNSQPKFIGEITKNLTLNAKLNQIMLYDQNGMDRVSIQVQLEYLKIQNRSVNNAQNLLQEIKNNQDLIGRNAYVLVIVIVDSFEEIGYKELNLDLKFHFNCQILGIFSDTNHIQQYKNLGFDEAVLKPITIDQLNSIWEKYKDL